MRIRLNQWKGAAAVAVFAIGLMAPATFGQDNPWVDTAEYELVVNGINKETNPQKKIQLLMQWKEKYPASKFKTARLQAMLGTYQQLANAPKMKEVAMEMTTEDASGVIGLIGFQTLNLLTFSMNDKSDAALADGEKAGSGLLAIIDKVAKPAQVADDAWAKEKLNNQVLGNRTLGWVAWQRKNYEQAEKSFTDALKLNPANGEISSWMGTVILLQRKPEKQSAGLYHFARAAVLEGAGALPDAARNQTRAYVEKTYTAFHGDKEGLDEIFAKAKADPFPPAGFEIESKLAKDMKNREKLKAENPMLGRWLELRDTLKGAEGDTYFGQLKDTNAGGALKGKLISATPETKPKELTLSIADGISPDVTLKLDEALPGKAEPGTEIEFEGTVLAYAKDPFNVTFDVDVAKVTGWPVQAKPAAKKSAAPAAKKAAPAAKKK